MVAKLKVYNGAVMQNQPTFKTESLNAFVQVALCSSFTGAANLLNQTPMAMSKQISKLEGILQEPLFERSTRRVSLTEFGQGFLTQAQKILEQHQTMDTWLESRTGKIAGTLRVVAQAPDVYSETLFPWLAEFCHAYPDIEFEFDLHDKAIDINKQKYDIYWGVGSYLGAKHPSLKSRSLWSSRYGIYASPKYLARHGVPESVEDLLHHRVIGYLHNQPDNILVIDKTPKTEKQQPDYISLDAPIKTVSGQMDLALQGLGLINAANDSQKIIEYVASGQLVPVLAENWWQSADIYLYYHDVKIEQPKIRAFIDFFLAKREHW